MDIVKSYGEKIKKFISEPDEGIYDALNKGIALATGSVVGILNSDDLYANDRVLENVAESMKDPSVDYCYGDLVYMDHESGKVVRFWKSGSFKKGASLREAWRTPPHPTFFVKASVYKQYGCFDTSYRIAADYDIMLRFLLDHKLIGSYIPRVLVKMRTGGVSNGGLRNLYRKSFEDFQILRRHGVRYPFWALMKKNVSKLNQFFHTDAV